MGGGARRGRTGFRRQRPVGRRVALAVAVYPPSGDHLFQLRRRYRTMGCQPACRTPDRTLVNTRTARSRQAVCRCRLIRLPDAAIGVPLLRAAAQAARGALPGPCCCSECGTPVTSVTRSAEEKQGTVLFADVVHSIDIAATVGAGRLREIMSELLDRSTAVVKRYGGTLSQFTGEGIMAMFGAPITLEDHAIRACLAALGIQEEAKRLAAGVQDRDGVDLRLRVGLNSGQVIAGAIGSGSFGYTAIGAQVGMAQRMESVAPPGAVMLSAS